MAQQVTTNTFTGGMVMDLSEISTPETVTTKALNATLSTFNGHEGTLQNDSGNVFLGATLGYGFIPIGSVEFNGIIYIVSVNDSEECEIGSFPSPNYSDKNSETLEYKYRPLNVLLDEQGNDSAFRTTAFGFNTENSVNVLAEPSFDGSINLILNDGKHKPRLINTGFHVQADNKYTIVKRIGENNTNRYKYDELDLATSLYKDYSKISKFIFNGLSSGGKLNVGNYVFYAVACDKDGNESDILCESGMIPVFLGTDGDPKSICGGIQDQISDKSISLTIKYIDLIYNYIKLYYSRTSAQDDQFAVTSYYKINNKFQVKEGTCDIIISGYEQTEQVDESLINTQYFNSSSAKAQAINQNMLFLGNVSTETGSDLHSDLINISLHIVPEVNISDCVINSNYSKESSENYYNSKFIYEKTGYHDDEYYRFGVVYIKNDNSLTQVYDIVGDEVLSRNSSNITPEHINQLINLSSDNYNTISLTDGHNINNKGVCKFTNAINQISEVIGVKFKLVGIDFTDLKNLGIKGIFFVRQKRIPTLLAQGFTTNICETSYLPSINVGEGLYNYESFVETSFDNYKGTAVRQYPKSNSTGEYLLRNEYERRLFTLTDNSWCYFDKDIEPIDAIKAHWEAISYSVDSRVWRNSTRLEFYGDESKYCVLNNTNCHGTNSWHKTDYYTDFYYFIKVPIEKCVELTGYNYQELTDKTNPAWASHYYCTKDNEDKYIKTITPELESKLEASSQLCKHKEDYWIQGDSWYGTGYRYEDDCLLRAMYYCFDFISKDSWNNDRYDIDPRNRAPIDISLCSRYALKNDDLYIFYATGEQGYNESTNSRSKEIQSFFENYHFPYDNYINKILGYDGEKGTYAINAPYNFTVPSNDGKYKYDDEGRQEGDDYAIPIRPMEFNSYGMFCPEFELNTPYYNNIFTGKSLKYKELSNVTYPESASERNYKINIESYSPSEFKSLKAIAVNENSTLNNITVEDTVENQYIDNHHNHYFSAVSGLKGECSFGFVGPKFLCYTKGLKNSNESNDFKDSNKLSNSRPFNIVRGIYSSYVGLVPETVSNIASKLIGIYTEDADNTNLIESRAKDPSAYYTISDRISIEDFSEITCYRGDCFINYFTHRINRNFNDSTSPYNDTILDPRTFRDNFDKLFSVEYRNFDLSKDAEAATNINIGDLNAVQLGSWITFPVRSSLNLALRGEDSSNVAEKLECGNNRSFYPRREIDPSGSNKIPESTIYNEAYSKSGGDKLYFNLGEVIYSKYYYKNRILYSNVLQQDSISNGTRVFLATHFRDYTNQYGEIVKLIPLLSNLLCVCEHGVLLIPVNERALGAEGAGGSVYINTSNVLPENPVVVSDTYGSKWKDSVISTPYGVFGIDSDSRKIWKTDGNQLQIISDFKVQSFLNKYLCPSKGQNIKNCNIKSHFNKQKNDVMFTLYDVDKENYWNLCYNINQQVWITFYSWIPILSENIGDCFITTPFDSDKANHLYKHGFSSRVPSESPQPCFWYDEQHPFEFEFIVRDKTTYHKIFENLQILSNNTPPESFHYEITGDCFDFASDKPAIYKRQEITKKLLKSFGSSIEYYNVDKYVKQSKKSTIFPLYYFKDGNSNKMYDCYKQINPFKGYNYDSLSGTEVIYNPDLNEFRLCNHAKAVDIKNGILRGNMSYCEDIWKIQINPINLVQHNESPWNDGKIPIVINNIKVNDATSNTITEDQLIDGYTYDDITQWDISKRKEVNVKDKYVKIRIRYKGDKYALISAIHTLYTISYN